MIKKTIRPRGGRTPRRDKAFDAAIGARIKERREAKGLTITALAEKVGVSIGQMSRYESGETTIEPSMLVNIAKILRCKPGLLLVG